MALAARIIAALTLVLATPSYGIWPLSLLRQCWGNLAGLAPEPPPKPPLHEGKSFDVVDARPDPAVSGGKILLLKDKSPDGKRVAPFEEGHLRTLLERFPDQLAALGIRKRKDGLVECPDAVGLNARMGKAFSRSGVKFYRDVSAEGASKLEMARRWANKEVPLSESGRDDEGRSLKLHDVFVHGLWYAMLPKELVDVSSENMKLLVELYDHPKFEKYPKLREAVLEVIEDEIGKNLELASASLPNNLLEGSAFNMVSNLFWISGTQAVALRERLARMKLPPEERKELDRILGGLRKVSWDRCEALAEELVKTSRGWK